MKQLTIKDIADLRGMTVEAVRKQVQRGVLRLLSPEFTLSSPNGRPARIVDPQSLTRAERVKLGLEVVAAPEPRAEFNTANIVEAAERVLHSMRNLTERMREHVRFLIRQRAEIVKEFQKLAGRRSAEKVNELCARWGAVSPFILQRWPSEAQPTSARALYRISARVTKGEGAALLGYIQPKHSNRISRRVAGHENRLRSILATLLYEHSTTIPVTTLHRVLSNQAEKESMPVPSIKWTRRVVDDLRKDDLFMASANKGAKGLLLQGPYIHVDKTTILPGAQYVMDNRQMDAEVISSDGSLCRPWLTRVVDHRTGLAVGWSILESAANGDSVMATITAAMLPKKPNQYNAIAGEVLGIICGVPDLWIVDNGKDFSNKRISGFSVQQTRNLIASAHEEVGDTRTHSEIVLGLLDETGARVRHAIPYNAKAKIVERTFRDMSLDFDKLVHGYVGSKPGQRPSHTDEMRKQHARLLKARCTRQELAKETGFYLIEQFSDFLEAWNWQWASRQDSRAQGLQHDGRIWSPVELWGKLAMNRRVPSAAMLERLSMVPEKRVVERGVIRVNRRAYYSDELLQFSGREVVARYSRLNPTSIIVEQVLGFAPFPAPMRVKEVEMVSAIATAEEIAAAMNAQRRARNGEAARIRGISSAEINDPLLEVAAQVARQGRETGRGQIVSINGQHVTQIISMRDEVLETEGTVVRDGADLFGLNPTKREHASWRFEQRASNG